MYMLDQEPLHSLIRHMNLTHGQWSVRQIAIDHGRSGEGLQYCGLGTFARFGLQYS